MMLEGLIAGGAFYIASRMVIDLRGRYRLKRLEKDLMAVEATISQLEEIESTAKAVAERRKMLKAFRSDRRKLAEANLPEADRYAACEFGFLTKEDTQTLMERYPKVSIDLTSPYALVRLYRYERTWNLNVSAHTTSYHDLSMFNDRDFLPG